MCLLTGSALKILILSLEQLVSEFIIHNMKECRQRITATIIHSGKCFYIIGVFIKIGIVNSPGVWLNVYVAKFTLTSSTVNL